MINQRRNQHRESGSAVQKGSRLFESLESRRLLSASLTTVIQPTLDLSASASSSASVSGYTPAQIAAAYGFNTVSFSGVSGTGAGQTIAIIDAYNDPNIASDLHVFDQQFGLSDPALTVVNQNGGSASTLATNAGWAGEISLDVEWAHAIAPDANILLVEANSATLGNLLSAVNYARSVSSVSVISMSWGSSEFFGETSYDSDFTTPSGHQGITFVASSGDDGSAYGPEWPASSPDVLSVGGTTLDLSSVGSVASETGWSDSGGGVSSVEPEPSYQSGVQSTGGKTSPDVSYNANPSTGYAVYDSISYEGYVGWQEVGGTSAGAPQWAALVAVADQGRVLAGKGTLDGASNTLPTLYSLYSAPGSAGYASYASEFDDITSGATSRSISAAAGYDEASGLGSPHGGAVVNSLLNAVTQTLTTTGSGSRPRFGRFGFFSRPATVTQANASSDITPVATTDAVSNVNVADPTAESGAVGADSSSTDPQSVGGAEAAVESRLASAAIGLSGATSPIANVGFENGPQMQLGALPMASIKIELIGSPMAGDSVSVPMNLAANSDSVRMAASRIVANTAGQVEEGISSAVSVICLGAADHDDSSRHALSVSAVCAGGLLIGYACLSASSAQRPKQKKVGAWPFAVGV